MDGNPCFVNVGELIFERTQSIWRRMRRYHPPPVRAHTHTLGADTPAVPSDACNDTRVPLSHVIAHLDEYTSTDIDAADAASSDSEPVNTCACVCVRECEITDVETTDTQTRGEPPRRTHCTKCRPARLTAFHHVSARISSPSQPHTNTWQLVLAGALARGAGGELPGEHGEHAGRRETGGGGGGMKAMGGDCSEDEIMRAGVPQIQTCIAPPLTAAGAMDAMCARVGARVCPQRRARMCRYRNPAYAAGMPRMCFGLTQWLVGAYEGDSASGPVELCGNGLQTAVSLGACMHKSAHTYLNVHRLSLRSEGPEWTATSLLVPDTAGTVPPCGTHQSVRAFDMQRLATSHTQLAGLLVETGQVLLLPVWHFASAASGAVARAVSTVIPLECRESSEAQLQMSDATRHATIASGCHLMRCCIEDGRAVVDSRVESDDLVCSIDSACSPLFGHFSPTVWALTRSGSIISWDTRTPNLSRHFSTHHDAARDHSLHAPLTRIKHADWCLLAGTAAGGVTAWDVRRPKHEMLHFEGTAYSHGPAAVTALSCDGLGLITGHKDGQVMTWSWEGSITGVHRNRPGGTAPMTCVGVDVDVAVGLGAPGDAVVLRYG